VLAAFDDGSTEPVYTTALAGPAAGATPGLDGSGNVYVVTRDGLLTSWDREGDPRFELQLETHGAPLPDASVFVTRSRLAVVVGAGRVFGVQVDHQQSTSAWFRFRRDNFSTGHR